MPSRDAAWALLLSASSLAKELDGTREPFTLDGLTWEPDEGWRSRLAADDASAGLIDIYLPIVSATASRPITIGHLGQSLDGFIATPSGDSQFVTGEENILHLHRMRALSDAVVVGAGTIATDDPQLTTRLVEGPNALRVVFDPTGRLDAGHRVFTDTVAPTLYICARSRWDGEDTIGRATVVPFDDAGPEPAPVQALAILRERGCSRVFVEGGGVTVSSFLESNLLDRLHMAIAPLLIGEGRPAIRLAPSASLSDCRRPRYRVFRMGGDVLFDCDLRHAAASEPAEDVIARVI